jgi:hypothetical protein
MPTRSAPLALFLILCSAVSAARAETAQANLTVQLTIGYTSNPGADGDTVISNFRVTTKDLLRGFKVQNPGSKVQLVTVRDTGDDTPGLVNERSVILVDGEVVQSPFDSDELSAIGPAEAAQSDFEDGVLLSRRRAGLESFALSLVYGAFTGPIVGNGVGVNISSAKRRTADDFLLYTSRTEDVLASVTFPAGGLPDGQVRVLAGKLSAGPEKIVP